MFLHDNQQSYEFFNEIIIIIIILIISAFSLPGKGSPVGMLELMLVFSPLYKTTKKDRLALESRRRREGAALNLPYSSCLKQLLKYQILVSLMVDPPVFVW